MSYFLIINNEQQGPFTLDELKDKKLSADTPVWHEGLADWAKVSEIEELKPFVDVKPPVFRQEEKVAPANFQAEKQSTPPKIERQTKERITFETRQQPNRNRLYLLGTIGVVSMVLVIWLITKPETSPGPNDSVIPNESNSSSPYNQDASNVNESINSEEKSTYQPSSNQSLNQKTEAQLHQELYEREQSNPKKYLDVNATHRVNLAANTIIEGTIYNSATIAAYKNIKLKVEFFSDTDYKLGERTFVVLDNVFANGSITFKHKIEGWWDNLDYFKCKIVSAENF